MFIKQAELVLCDDCCDRICSLILLFLFLCILTNMFMGQNFFFLAN